MRRNLRKIILVSLFSVLSAAEVSAQEKDWTSLFNGKNLNGWQTHPEDNAKWEVKDSAIVGSGPVGHLFSERGDYQNFHFRIEAKINDKGNSGQYVRAVFAKSFPPGYEIQINSTDIDKIRTGSLYPDRRDNYSDDEKKKMIVLEQMHKPDEWFTQEVIAVDNHIIVKVNGKTTVDFVDEKNRYRKGYFALQQIRDGSVITVRKAEVKELSPATRIVADKPVAPAAKKLLIVAAKAGFPVLAAFVEHKKKLLPTELIALEDIVKETKGADDAEKLKRYLYNRWKADKIGYVLLVGDAEVMPVRYIAISDGTKETGGTTFAPCDLYYSDLAKKDGSFDDWNANKEGINAQYFGQLKGFDGKDPINVDQIDYLPDIAVGRWPVHTLPHLQAVIIKSIRYESHVLADDLPAIRRTAFVNGPGLEDVRQRMDDWGRKLEGVSKWNPLRLYYKDNGRDDKTPPPNEAEVGKILQNGVGMIFHVGHGSETCWDGCLDIKSLGSLRDANLPPVMFSIGCTTALYGPIAPGCLISIARVSYIVASTIRKHSTLLHHRLITTSLEYLTRVALAWSFSAFHKTELSPTLVAARALRAAPGP